MPYCRERGLAKSHYCQKGVSPTMAISDFSQIVATRISPNHRTTSAEAAQQRRFLGGSCTEPQPGHQTTTARGQPSSPHPTLAVLQLYLGTPVPGASGLCRVGAEA